MLTLLRAASMGHASGGAVCGSTAGATASVTVTPPICTLSYYVRAMSLIPASVIMTPVSVGPANVAHVKKPDDTLTALIPTSMLSIHSGGAPHLALASLLPR